MNIVATLTDSSGTLQLPPIEVALQEQTLENATDVVTLDFNVYTDFINTKRQWTLSNDHLDEDTYNALRAYYDRQFTDYAYPVLAIDHYDVSTPVRMYLNTKEVWNDCGSIQNIQMTLRETDQLYSDVDYLLLDDGGKLYIDNTSFLTL